MFVAGLAGMLAGLWLDAGQQGGVAWLAAACVPAGADIWASIRFHWQVLPAMHLGMLLGGLVAGSRPWTWHSIDGWRHCGWGRRLCCAVCMIVGMDTAVIAAPWRVSGGWTALVLMCTGMLAGTLMVWGVRALWARCRHLHPALLVRG